MHIIPSIIYFSSNKIYQNLEFDIKSENLQIKLEEKTLYLYKKVNIFYDKNEGHISKR